MSTIHFVRDPHQPLWTACGKGIEDRTICTDPEKVTCQSCRATKAFRRGPIKPIARRRINRRYGQIALRLGVETLDPRYRL